MKYLFDEWGFEHCNESGKSVRMAVITQQYTKEDKTISKRMGLPVLNPRGVRIEQSTVGYNASITTESGAELLVADDRRKKERGVLVQLLYEGQCLVRTFAVDAVRTMPTQKIATRSFVKN